MKRMGRVTEAKTMTETTSVPVAEPIAMVFQPLEEDFLVQGVTAAGSDDSAVFERLRTLRLDWHDPFYSGSDNHRDETVLASFEIDHDSVQAELKSEDATIIVIITRLPVVLALLFMLRSDWKENKLVAAVTFLVVFCIANVILSACTTTEPSKDMLLALRRHVAIGRGGVYLDEADQSDRNLARRQVIPFSAIATCRLAEVGLNRPCYHVIITTVPTPMSNGIESTNHKRRGVGGDNDKLQAEYVIRGICKAQAFVDVVQMAIAMKARSHTARTTSDPV